MRQLLFVFLSAAYSYAAQDSLVVVVNGGDATATIYADVRMSRIVGSVVYLSALHNDRGGNDCASTRKTRLSTRPALNLTTLGLKSRIMPFLIIVQNHRFRTPPSWKSNVFQRFFKGNQMRFASESGRLNRSDYEAAVIALASCADIPARSTEKAAHAASRAIRASWAMNLWRGNRPKANSRKSSQRAFAISRFWWLLTPFFMTRQNQKAFLRRNLSNSPIFAEPSLSATKTLRLLVDGG